MSGPKGATIDYEQIRRRQAEARERAYQKQQEAYRNFNKLKIACDRYTNIFNNLKVTHHHSLPNTIEKRINNLKSSLFASSTDYDAFNDMMSEIERDIKKELELLEQEKKHIEAKAKQLRNTIIETLKRQNADISKLNELQKELADSIDISQKPIADVDDIIDGYSRMEYQFDIKYLTAALDGITKRSAEVNSLKNSVIKDIDRVKKSERKLRKMLDFISKNALGFKEVKFQTLNETEAIINTGITTKKVQDCFASSMAKLEIYLSSKYRYSEALTAKNYIDEFYKNDEYNAEQKINFIERTISELTSRDLDLSEAISKYSASLNQFILLLANYEELLIELDLPEDTTIYRYDYSNIEETNTLLSSKIDTLVRQKELNRLLSIYEKRMEEYGYQLLEEKTYQNGITKVYSLGANSGLEITLTAQNDLHTRVVGFESIEGKPTPEMVGEKMEQFCHLRDQIHSEALSQNIPVKDLYKLPASAQYVEYINKPGEKEIFISKQATQRRSGTTLLQRHLTLD